MSHHRESAKRLLVHYFRFVLEKAGGKWINDNQWDIEGIVDAIVDAAVSEIRAREADTIAQR